MTFAGYARSASRLPGYRIAVHKGFDVDQCRNLAESAAAE
jgi:glucosamine 6-phosphate synthetase-like amidotransferase/phosphosugar isomerase protein